MKIRLLIPIACLALTCIGCGPPDGETVYNDLGCQRCHGFQLEGNRYGPPLERIADHWESADSIVTYMKNPAAVVEKDPRLKAQDADYDLRMQPVTSASEEELRALADWLLAPQ